MFGDFWGNFENITLLWQLFEKFRLLLIPNSCHTDFMSSLSPFFTEFIFLL